MAVNEGPFATYADVLGVVNATAASEIAALFVTLKTLIPDGSEGSSPAPHPDFDTVDPAAAVKLIAELDAVAAAIAAAPTA
jgi:hypothetical protein